jgi:hypothetical protein
MRRLGEPPVLLGVLTFILCLFAHAFCVLSVLFGGGDLSACGLSHRPG